MKATLIVMGESYYGIESTGWVRRAGARGLIRGTVVQSVARRVARRKG